MELGNHLPTFLLVHNDNLRVTVVHDLPGRCIHVPRASVLYTSVALTWALEYEIVYFFLQVVYARSSSLDLYTPAHLQFEYILYITVFLFSTCK